MAINETLDIVAFAGQRKFSQLGEFPDGEGRPEWTELFVQTLLDGGWEQLTDPEEQANGDGYTFASQQSPWYDEDNIPAWYKGNRIYLEINNAESAHVRLFVGALYDDELDIVDETDFTLRIRADFFGCIHTGYNFLINPYQIVAWSDRSDDFLESTRDIFISAVNIPKSLAQRSRLIHNIIADNLLRYGSTNDELLGGSLGCRIFRDRTTSAIIDTTNLGEDAIQFLCLQGPWNGVGQTGTGCRIWNPSLDPMMTNHASWSPFIGPPYTVWKQPGEDNRTINGFVWDGFIMSEGFEKDSIITLQDRTFICFATMTRTGAQQSPSLWFNIDEIQP